VEFFCLASYLARVEFMCAPALQDKTLLESVEIAE